MKKVIISIILIIAVIIGVSYSANKKGYDVGRDTDTTFCNGTYQIFDHYVNGQPVKGLSHNKYHQCIVDKIEHYNEVENNIYIVGVFNSFSVYVIIDTKTTKLKFYPVIQKNDILGMTNLQEMVESGDVEYISEYNMFSEKEKKVFSDILKK